MKTLTALLAFWLIGAASAAAQQPVVVCAPGIITSNCAPVSTPIVTAAAANNLVLKTSPGTVVNVFAANHTGTAGFLVLLNATAAPSDGAITPLDCAALPANGNATINYSPGPVALYNVGITAVLTSASTCFTKTTGVITG